MTVAMYHETATAANGENRDLVGASSFPRLENPTSRSREDSEKNKWEPAESDAPNGDGTEMNASIHGADAANASRGANQGHVSKVRDGGESPNSALTTCRDGDRSSDPPTRDASAENTTENEERGRSESIPATVSLVRVSELPRRPAPSDAGAEAAAEEARRLRDEIDDDARAREACASCFASSDDEGRMRELRAMGQKELQDTFRVAFGRATTSNNNQWLRRRIAGALGLEAAPDATHRAARIAGGSSARGTPGASPGSGLTTPGSVGGTITEDGVRKSNRAAKPKILDFLPSAVCAQVANELPGEAAIDRRVRVFWPAEGAFFSGTVQAFNPKNGKHSLRYDDGDVEEVLLAAERIEWVFPGEDATEPRAPATAAGGGALSAKTKAVVVVAKRINFSVPQPGKPAEVLEELGPTWPSPGQHVWGRVKGHGWWPGAVLAPSAAESSGVATPWAHKDDAALRFVKFFDNTAAVVHRNDLLPFREYEKTLARAKKSASFQTALRAAKRSFDKAAKRGAETALPVHLTKQQRAAAAKAVAAANDQDLGLGGSGGVHDSGFVRDGEDPARFPKRKSAEVDSGEGSEAFPRISNSAVDPAGVPPHPGAVDAQSAKLEAQSPKKRAKCDADDTGGFLGELERRVGFAGDGNDFVRAAEAKIAAEAMMASAPERSRNRGGFQKPEPRKRSHKKGQGLKARAAAEAAGLPWPPPRPPGVGRGRGRGAGNQNGSRGLEPGSSGGSGSLGSGSGSGKHRHHRGVDAAHHREQQHHPAHHHVGHLGHVGPGVSASAGNPGDQLGLLSRKLDALQTRVVPLAIAASQHLRKQLQVTQLAAARGGNPQMHPSVMMTESERATLLDEMEVLQRLLHWSDDGQHQNVGNYHHEQQHRPGSQQHARGQFSGAPPQTVQNGHQAQARYFQGESYGGVNAGIDSERGGSDPDLARLDSRWGRGGLDSIEMAMLRAEHGGRVVGDAMADGGGGGDDDDMDGLWDGPDGSDDGDDLDVALEAADYLRSAGPSIEVDTIMAEVHAARRLAQTQNASEKLEAEKHFEKSEKKSDATAAAPGAPGRAGSPAPSDTTQ